MSDLFFGNFVFGLDEVIPYEEYKGPTTLLEEVCMLADAFNKRGGSIMIHKVLRHKMETSFGAYVIIGEKYKRATTRFFMDFKGKKPIFKIILMHRPSYYLEDVDLEDSDTLEKLQELRDWLYNNSI